MALETNSICHTCQINFFWFYSVFLFVCLKTGLCGGVHSSVVRLIRNELSEDSANLRVVCVGDKSRVILQRLYGKNIILAGNDIGRLPPTFNDASKVADAILNSEYSFGSGQIVYNQFKSVVSYSTKTLPVFSLEAVKVSVNCQNFDVS